MNKKREYRTASNGSTTKVEGNTLAGYIALFNSLSEDLGGFREVLAPGCFAGSAGKDIRALINHNTDTVVGRTSAGTLTLSEDAKGLAYSIDLPDTQAARDLKVSAARGDVTGCSFGFFCNADEWNGAENVRTVKDVELFEVSVGVTFPAYESTTMQLRSRFPDGLIERGIGGEPHKTVDGEVLHADDFLIVLKADDPETWNLPWKFSTEEKTVSHLRDALARFDQLEDVPPAVKQDAWKRLVELCKQYGIDVSPDDTREWKETMELRLQLAKRRAQVP